MVERKVLYFEVGVQHPAAVEVGDVEGSGSLSGKLEHRDVQDVEDVAQFDLFQVQQQCVGRIFRNRSFHVEIFGAVGDGKVLYPDLAVCNGDGGRGDVPGGIVQDQRTFVQRDFCA